MALLLPPSLLFKRFFCLKRNHPHSISVKFSLTFLLFLIITVPLLISTTNQSFGRDITKSEIKKNSEISSFRIKIRRLQQGISNQEESISKTQTKEINILAELELLDQKLFRQRHKLETLEDKKLKQQALIDKDEDTLITIHSEKDIVKEHLKKRITAYYTMGDIGLLNVTFSAKTLPELLKFHDAFASLIRYDQDVIKVYKGTIKELEKTKDLLDLEKGILLDFIYQTVKETKVLEETRVEKTTLLTMVRTQTKLHQQAAREMQLASETLSRSIVTIKNKHRIYERGFLLNMGSIPPPVDGILITLFRQEKRNKLGILRMSNGIELNSPDGTKIIAVENGIVIFSGYLRGYGNTVIIHHGFQYFTVTARIEKILVTQGQKVNTEDVIGVVGDTAMLLNEGLYFEIRHGKQSLDPLLWLNPNRLSILHELSADNSAQERSVH